MLIPRALEELRMIVSHLIEREYQSDINQNLVLPINWLSWLSCFASVLLHWWPIGYVLVTARVILTVTTAPLVALPSTMDLLDSVKF
jgi:hypothetical protein